MKLKTLICHLQTRPPTKSRLSKVTSDELVHMHIGRLAKKGAKEKGSITQNRER